MGCWGLFSCDIQSNAGCFYCRCCCDPASREVAAEKQTELNFEHEDVISATKPTLDEPDVVRIEGAEKYHPRGASSCGFIACQTDSYINSGWGLFSSDIQSNV